MQEMVYLKAIQKSPMSVSVSGTTDQKTYLKKFRGGASAPLAPPGFVYAFDHVGYTHSCNHVLNLVIGG